ncbi:hypothetical protein Sbs19_45290 [Sphingobium sp. BS19]|nr:hypothetical protein Sbs19_45290 [Sphingobium sp. BS19]
MTLCNLAYNFNRRIFHERREKYGLIMPTFRQTSEIAYRYRRNRPDG